jgi:hypothetical protein
MSIKLSDIEDTKTNNIISPERYVFWLDDLKVLYKNENYIKFVPTNDMSRVEQLNAMTRFCIYLLILFLLFGKGDEWIYLPIIGVIFIIVLYNLFDNDEEGKKTELFRMKQKVKSPVTTQPEVNYRTYTVDDDGETRVVDIDLEEQKNFMKSIKSNNDNNDIDIDIDLDSLDTLDRQSLNLNSSDTTNFDLEAGYIDSNGDFQYGSNYEALSSKETDKDNIKFSLDEFRIYEKNKCRKPSKDNPFMNPSVNDFNTPNVPVACNADDEDINDDMKLKFNQDMYRDLEDVFNRKNSQRQFFTVHHSIPNDQEGFARWCYKMPATCKEDQARCLKYQDLRTKY